MASGKEEENVPGVESDDDMPDLESVGSSEYSDEDVVESTKKSKEQTSKETAQDSPPQPPQDGPILRHDHSYIRHWLYEYISEHIKVPARKIKLQLLSPCLYGTFSLDDKWINWIYEAGLIHSKSEFQTQALSDNELLAVEAIERAANVASPFLDSRPREEKELFGKLVEAVDSCGKLREVMKVVKEYSWFMERLPKVIPPSWTKYDPPHQNFFETALVYAIVNTVKKSGSLDTDSDLDDEHTLKASERYRLEGNRLYADRRYEDAVEQYDMAIILCPFVYDVYGSRAIAHFQMGRFRAAVSDGYRCIVLNPDGWKGYSRYSCALHGLGDKLKSEGLHREVLTAFPKEAIVIRREWAKCLEISMKFPKEKITAKKVEKSSAKVEENSSEAKKEERLKRKQGKAKKLEAQRKLEQQLKVIDAHLAAGSEKMQHGHPVEAVQEYSCAVKNIMALKGKWQEAQGGESNRVMATILYLQAKAKIEGEGVVLEAMQELQTVLHKHSFPAVHLELALCHIHLNRFKDAERELYQGLTQMPNYHKNFSPFFWPGLSGQAIEDLRPHILENKIRQMREFCVPRGRPDAVCRFHGCQQMHLTTNIFFDELDTKGFASVLCSEGCCTSMHYDCWRKKREELVITNDKDMMTQPCLTSDCEGIVIEVKMVDSGGVKYRTQHSEPRENRRPQVVKENRSPITSASHWDRVLRKRREWREKRTERKEKRLQKGTELLLSEEDTRKDSPVEEKTVVVNGGTKEEALDEMQIGSPQRDSRLGSEMLLRREGKVSYNGDRKDSKTHNSRKKKSKGSEEKSSSSAAELAQLFTTTMDGRNAISANDEIDNSGNVVKLEMLDGGPEQPFARPLHMQGDLQEFERKEVPQLGIKPDIRRAATAPASSAAVMTTPGEESLFTYFADVLKERGPLDTKEQTLQDALNFLPDESKAVIEKRGGLIKFLKLSPNIDTHGSLVCLKEDSQAVMESMHLGNGYRDSKGKVSSSNGRKTWAEKVKNSSRRADASSPVSCETEDADMFGSMFVSLPETPGVSTDGGEVSKAVDMLSQPEPESSLAALFDTDSQPGSNLSLSPEMAEMTVVPPPKAVPSKLVKKEKGMQTDRIKRVDFAMNTDLFPQDNHRQMYENARRERDRLSLRVRELEDEKVKLKRSLNVEIEKTVKSAKEEVKVEMEEHLSKLRMQLADEQRRLEKERKEKQDQSKAANKENKGLQEKLEKSKKEVLQCRQELDQQSLFHSREVEQLSKEKSAVEDRLRVAHNTAQRARERAIDAELCLLQVQRETKVKEIEALIREAELISEATQSNEWKGYRANLREILDAYKATITSQLHDIQQGKEYANLEKAMPDLPPKPAMPAVNQLALRQMQQMRQLQMMQAMKAQGQVGGIPLMMPGAIRPPPLNTGGVGKMVPVSAAPLPTTGLRPLLPGTDAGAVVHQLPVARVMEGAKSGVERIWELLQQEYPNLERDHLRSILREIRKENGNTLQSLSVDVIAQKVRGKLGDPKRAQEGAATGSQTSSAAVSAGTTSEPVSSAPTVFPSAFPTAPQQGQMVASTGVGGPSVLLPMARQASMVNYITLRQPPPSNQPQIGGMPQVSQAARHPEVQPTSMPPGSYPFLQQSQMKEPISLPSAHIRLAPPFGPTSSATMAQGFPPQHGLHPQAPVTTTSIQSATEPKLAHMPVIPLSQQQVMNMQMQVPIRRPVAVAPPPKQRPAEPLAYGEDECVICAEDMEEFDTLHLDCGHKFHDKCIRTWLNEQSTCPTCRDHVLLQEDFPEL